MTTLTINIDEKLKAKAQKKSKKDGLNLTALIAQLLKTYVQTDCELCVQMRREGKELKPEILESTREAQKELENGTAKLYNNIDELRKDILSEPDEPGESKDLRNTNNAKI